MPLIDVGAGATDDQTTRVVAATDSPEVEALGASSDEPAFAAMSDASVVAVLKALALSLPAAISELALELKRIRVGLSLLTNTDLESEVPC